MTRRCRSTRPSPPGEAEAEAEAEAEGEACTSSRARHAPGWHMLPPPPPTPHPPGGLTWLAGGCHGPQLAARGATGHRLGSPPRVTAIGVAATPASPPSSPAYPLCSTAHLSSPTSLELIRPSAARQLCSLLITPRQPRAPSCPAFLPSWAARSAPYPLRLPLRPPLPPSTTLPTPLPLPAPLPTRTPPCPYPYPKHD